MTLKIPRGAFAYPLFIGNGATVRCRLIEQKIYVPKLWPDISEGCRESYIADNILPLPVDQRYDGDDMSYLIDSIKEGIID